MPFPDVYSFLWKSPFFLCYRSAPRTAVFSFFFLPFFFVFFIHVKFLRSRFSLLRVLSVSRIQTNVYVWVPISIKTFPRRAAANHLSPFTISSPTPALRTSVNPSHPRLLFSRRTYFINARPLLTVAPLDDR